VLRLTRAVLAAVALLALLWSGGLAWFADTAGDESERPRLVTLLQPSPLLEVLWFNDAIEARP